MNMSRFTTFLLKTLCALTALVLCSTSCKDDDELIIASVSVQRTAVYIPTPSTSEVVTFTTQNAVGMSITGSPIGWDVTPNFAARTITITSPAADNEEAEKSGTIYLYVYSETSNATQFEIYVSCEMPESLASQRSNCYVITQADKSYSIPVTLKGEGNETIPVSQVNLIWQSAGNLISHLQMMNDQEASFHVEPANSKGGLMPGNALIGGYDEANNLLWTWHVWITSTPPTAVGRYMDRNLGAEQAAHASQQEILNSYGTYYQWGRMTPFIGPYYYNCASSENALMYLTDNSYYAYLHYVLATSETGTLDYALANPMYYLLSDENLAYDWNATHDADLWSADHKTLYDPCPKGWRVADNFDDLSFAGDPTIDLALLEQQFGWELTDGENTLFFLGGGRRSWLQGKITNVNTAAVPKPWIGYYWTATTTVENQSQALYFSLDTENPEASEFLNAIPSPRANGMQIRCIKE